MLNNVAKLLKLCINESLKFMSNIENAELLKFVSNTTSTW